MNQPHRESRGYRNDTIAERIRFAMNVRNVKQVEMVQRTGITKGAFSSYLSGNYNPKKDKLELIADALDYQY